MSQLVSATSRSVLLATLLGGGIACHQEPARAPEAASPNAEQAIVERSADAFTRLRASGAPQLDSYVEHAHGVMIFPRLIKASLIFGGEGGNGVLVVKGADGSWSNPAFYSLGAPSVGLQIGYQEATVVLFFMEESVLQKAMHADISLGTNTSVALGRVGDVDSSRGEVFSKPIYQLIDARGAFVGVSLDGYVVSARNAHNQAYYGGPVTPRDILVERTEHRPEADVLLRALAAPPRQAQLLPPQAAGAPSSRMHAEGASSENRGCDATKGAAASDVEGMREGQDERCRHWRHECQHEHDQ